MLVCFDLKNIQINVKKIVISGRETYRKTKRIKM